MSEIDFTVTTGLQVSSNIVVGSYANNATPVLNGIIVSGNVGIGTANPQAPLHVINGVMIDGGLTLNGSSAISSNGTVMGGNVVAMNELLGNVIVSNTSITAQSISLSGNITAQGFIGNANYANVVSTGATTSRSLADRFADVVYAADFGVVGDYNAGAHTGTDNTNALNAAIQAAQCTTDLGGKTLVLPAGHILTGPLTLNYPIRIVGQGSDTTSLILKSGSNTACISVTINSGTNYPAMGYPFDTVNLSHFRVSSVDSKSSNLTVPNAHGISLNYGSRYTSVYIDHVTVYDMPGNGIQSVPSPSPFNGYCQMDYCILVQNGGNGLETNSTEDWSLNYAQIYENQLSGWQSSGDGEFYVTDLNSFTNQQHGVYIYGNGVITFSGHNEINDNGWAGIYLNGFNRTLNIQGGVVFGNNSRITPNTYPAMLISGGVGTVIIGSTQFIAPYSLNPSNQENYNFQFTNNSNVAVYCNDCIFDADSNISAITNNSTTLAIRSISNVSIGWTYTNPITVNSSITSQSLNTGNVFASYIQGNNTILAGTISSNNFTSTSNYMNFQGTIQLINTNSSAWLYTDANSNDFVVATGPSKTNYTVFDGNSGIRTGNINIFHNIYASNIISNSSITSATLSTSGNVYVANLTSNAVINTASLSASGNISATNLFGVVASNFISPPTGYLGINGVIVLKDAAGDAGQAFVYTDPGNVYDMVFATGPGSNIYTTISGGSSATLSVHNLSVSSSGIGYVPILISNTSIKGSSLSTTGNAYVANITSNAVVNTASLNVSGNVTFQSGSIQSITPGASPYTYTATQYGTVYTSGGTVSQIQLKRGATTISTGLTGGGVLAAPNDNVIVTYSSTPTMNFVPL